METEGLVLKQKRRWRRSAAGIGIALCMAVTMSSSGVFATDNVSSTQNSAASEDFFSKIPVLENAVSYQAYLEEHSLKGPGSAPITIEGSSFDKEQSEGASLGADGSTVVTAERGKVSWSVEVPNSGMYNVSLEYYPTEGKGSSIERDLLINGELPFKESSSLMFYRLWQDKDKTYLTQTGNQTFPSQVETPAWETALARDVNGFYTEPLKYYLEKGTNLITLRSVREPMEIRKMVLQPPEQPVSYSQYVDNYKTAGAVVMENEMVKIQAEEANLKSSPSFAPLNDRTSMKTEPYHPSNIIMNTIGGKSWANAGDWMEWTINVPKTGFYNIATRFKQGESRGLFVTRKLTINGAVPFKEAEDIRFQYKGQFQVSRMVDVEGQDLLFYFEEGENKIRLEASLGAFAQMINQVENSTAVLNNLYRDIVVITGVTPDKYRDYQFTQRIPHLVSTMEHEAAYLEVVLNELNNLTGGSDKTAVLSKTVLQLRDTIKKPDLLAKNLASFKDNITALGKWTLDIKPQPLTLDYIMLCGTNTKLPKAEGNFFQGTWHELQAFGGSFFNTFTPESSVDGKDVQELDVWVTTGRDQMEVIRRLINETFETQNNTKVSLKLVSADVLLPATFTGRGPDVAIQIGSTLPVNFAFRDAALDLTQFGDFEEVKGRFLQGAMDYFKYNGGYYALPDQMSFPVVFYRKDVLSELQIPVPDTWDDIISVIPMLQKNNMEVYLDTATQLTLGSAASVGNSKAVNSVFLSMLYQNGGTLYNADGSRCEIDQPIGVDVFKSWTEFYTKHSFPKEADFVTRFRVGEVPIGVVDYTTYNKLSVSAPEIRGVWDISPMLGTLQEDGSIRRDTPCITSASLIVKNSVDRRGTKDVSWEFLKWWTSEETQAKYAREMESVLGSSARYPVANVAALEQSSWPAGPLSVLTESLEWVKGVEQVPGSYITGRYIDNAFKAVINDDLNPTENLYEYADMINDELIKKRTEFGLEGEGASQTASAGK